MTDRRPRQIVKSFLEVIQLPPGPAHACPYLPDRQARNVGFAAEHMDPDVYAALMDRGFRRSGTLFYQPACSACQECVPIRVPVVSFQLTRSQKRVWKRNADLAVRAGPPQLTPEKWRLYCRYIELRHPGGMRDSYEDLRDFLYRSPVKTEEIGFFQQDRLIGVSIIDVSTQALSSVYMFFDPDQAQRSLGTYSTLWEIEECRRRQVPYYYLGYYIADCAKMNYKVKFRAHERLYPGRGWVGHEAIDGPPG